MYIRHRHRHLIVISVCLFVRLALPGKGGNELNE